MQFEKCWYMLSLNIILIIFITENFNSSNCPSLKRVIRKHDSRFWHWPRLKRIRKKMWKRINFKEKYMDQNRCHKLKWWISCVCCWKLLLILSKIKIKYIIYQWIFITNYNFICIHFIRLRIRFKFI